MSHPWLFSLAVLVSVLAQGITSWAAILVGNIIDAITIGAQDTFFIYMGIAALIVFLIWLTLYVMSIAQFVYGIKTARTLKKDFFDGVFKMKISEYNQNNSAKYISMLTNDIMTITTLYFNQIPNVVRLFGGIFISLIVMAVVSPINALFALVTSFLPLIAPLIYSKKLAVAQAQQSAAKMIFIQKTKDYLTGFEVFKTFNRQTTIGNRFFGVIKKLSNAQFKSVAATSGVGALSFSAIEAATFINYFVAGFFVLRGDITIGELVAIIALAGTLLQPIGQLSANIGMLKSAKTISERVLEVVDTKDTRQRDTKIDSLKGNIELKNLSFTYESGTDEQNPIVLKNVNYTFEKGKKYAIAGESGSGKSTIAKLIMGYYDNYEGDVLINSHNVYDIERESLYKTFSMLHQNVFILDDTLKNNITLYHKYSDHEYKLALEKANLLDVEANLPNGSKTSLGEGGNILSGGERQRVSIARTILKGSEVLILDEATASLDNVIAHDIENSIIEMEDLTCIFVTHRYSKDILEKCDGILVMKNGELFEHGSFDELYENKGYFYSLYNTIADD